MLLKEAVELGKLTAGGLGSGCRGPNCGRHGHGSFDRMMKRRMKVWKTPHTSHQSQHPLVDASKRWLQLSPNLPKIISHHVAAAVDYDADKVMNFIEFAHHAAEYTGILPRILSPELHDATEMGIANLAPLTDVATNLAHLGMQHLPALAHYVGGLLSGADRPRLAEAIEVKRLSAAGPGWTPQQIKIHSVLRQVIAEWAKTTPPALVALITEVADHDPDALLDFISFTYQSLVGG
jgi:hypothetical protein